VGRTLDYQPLTDQKCQRTVNPHKREETKTHAETRTRRETNRRPSTPLDPACPNAIGWSR